MAKIDYDGMRSEPTDDQLTRLGKLAQRQLELEDELERLQQRAKELQEKHRVVSEVDLPALLDETGLSQVRLADGTRVVIREDLRVSTTGKNRDVINRWLEGRGLDDVIKDEVTAAFGKGDAAGAKSAMALLTELGAVAVDHKRYVNPQTFSALLRELRDGGEDVPYEELGVFVQRRAKLDRAS